jgi:FlaG/FlaF family flagellin (archaellin)
MRVQYINVLANVPKIVPLDTNDSSFQVTLRTNTASVDVTVDNVFDTTKVPSWYPATVSSLVPGAYVLDAVVSAVRLSSPDGEVIRLVQTGSFRNGPPPP